MILSTRCNAATAALALLLVATNPIDVASFQLSRSTPLNVRTMTNNVVRTFTPLHADNHAGNDTPRDEEVVGEQYEGTVDWDAEWKKVVEDRDQPKERPGNYKTQAEIAAIKATNKVAKNVYDASREAKAKLPSASSFRSLQGDWRFWIGILLIVSFGLSLLSATSSTTVNDSFYI